MLLLDTSRVYDFVLSQDNSLSIDVNGELTDRCLVSYIDTNNKECVDDNGDLSSMYTYSYADAVNDGPTLLDFGFTGIDNGRILFDKTHITNREFFNILTKTVVEMPSGDTRLHLSKVSGNTQFYDYNTEFVSGDTESYYALKGGFFQGYYKLFGFDYQVLPQYIENAWNLEFVIRPRSDYDEVGHTLNTDNKENKGVFFYMGTRAENKFFNTYGCDLSQYPKRDTSMDPEHCPELLNTSYFAFDWDMNKDKKRLKVDLLFLFRFGEPLPFNTCCPNGDCGGESGKTDDDCASFLSDEDYVEPDIILSAIDILTSNGRPVTSDSYYEIPTDNGYLIYDRTKDGFTTDTWNSGDELLLSGYKEDMRNINLYLLMNRTKNGYTTETIGEYIKKNKQTTPCDIMKDVKGNAFSLKYNDDGSVGYRYLVKDCNAEDGWSVLEEKTYPGMIEDGKWSTVNVMFKILNGGLDKCGKPLKERRMKIYLYVNGYLKLVSKELPEFNFRELDDFEDKQEGVPFNISLGGGTQGLAESLWIDYYDRFPYIFPIEQNFAGTFIGDIRSFKFYDCPLQYNEIKNNYIFESKK